MTEYQREAAENLMFRLNKFESKSTQGQWEGLFDLKGGAFVGLPNRNGLTDDKGDYLNRNDILLICALQNHLPIIRALLEDALRET